MKLSELAKAITVLERTGGDPEIRGIRFDSRAVEPGDLFVAIPGMRSDGSRFVLDALSRGAAALAVEGDIGPVAAPVIRVAAARKALAHLARAFYGKPDEELAVFGVTGTNGKTTTAHLLRAILEAWGKPTSLLGTIEHQILGKNVASANTTPESADLFRFFRQTKDGGGKAVVMEVSSHSLALDRVEGISFAGATFSNLTHDHLDFHNDMENYFASKAKLFLQHLKSGGHAAVNVDDPYGVRLAGQIVRLRPDIRLVTFGSAASAQVHPIKTAMSWEGIEVELATPWGTVNLGSKLTGTFNVSNLMAAASLALSFGIPAKAVISAVGGMDRVNGRFEKMAEGQDFTVLVDYAHTPDALERVLRTARSLTQGRLLVVFGCGGDRDKTKRPIMGRIASELADMIFVTSDNPRTEDKDAIIREILSGVIAGKAVLQVEPDRRLAIAKAVGASRRNDCLVIAGKGHENYQIMGTEKLHFDDHEVAAEYLREKREGR